jgi:hypothetical protein
MAKRNFTKVVVISLVLVGLALTLTTFAAVTVSTNLSSSGSVTTTANLGVYSDVACTSSLSSLDWGTITPGNAVARTVYVKNTGSGVSLSLSLTTTNWNPVSANGPITVTWDKETARLTPGQSTAAVITLSVSSSIIDVSNFSVQIIISGA